MAKDNSDVDYSVYEIPQDVTTAGKWFDTFDTVNVVQAFVMTILIIFLFTKVITVNIFVGIVIWVISILFTLISYGDNHDTLYMYLFLIIRTAFIRRTYRRYILIKKRRPVKNAANKATIVKKRVNSLKAIPFDPIPLGMPAAASAQGKPKPAAPQPLPKSGALPKGNTEAKKTGAKPNPQLANAQKDGKNLKSAQPESRGGAAAKNSANAPKPPNKPVRKPVYANTGKPPDESGKTQSLPKGDEDDYDEILKAIAPAEYNNAAAGQKKRA